ncbi:hypothetical protein BTN33_02520 [Aeromonas veronii]|uniref:EAL domain-containing protein n=1 Tax=Aeromonas veronii TaxID=654 RepID=UPI0009470408|nr:EAL domain-containing protein [Aeromonas veronii]OLF60436.1 hypothetical protein BTN33_02520 [Aeromonas veronii]
MSPVNSKFIIKLFGCMAITVIPLLTLSALMYISFIIKSESRVLASAQKAVDSIESILDYGLVSNNAALTLKDLPCSKAALELRRQVTTVPYVRSVNLAKNGSIYCTSLFGARSFKDNRSEYIDGKLLLMPGNNIQTNHPLVVIRSENGDTASLSGIDSIYFKQLLTQQENDGLLLFLHVNNEWLTADGVFLNETPEGELIVKQSVTSNNYPFSIYAGLNDKSAVHAFWVEDKVYIIVLICVLSSFSMLTWWQLNRPRAFSSELMRALKKQEFVPYAQPLVDAVTRQIIGVEILMRWQHPTQGLIRPDLFIPQAEESGLIVPMTDHLFKMTAKILKQHKDDIPGDFHVGINITAQHCKGMRLLLDCQEFLAELKSERINLVLELTERQELENSAHVLDLFTRLNKMGVMLAIDDFGTGHSSLGYLKNFKVGCLKIDMSFVRQIGEGSLSDHLIDNIIDLGRRLSLTLVAEGVENEMQAKFLQEKGVTYLQGYMFGKPTLLKEALLSLRAGVVTEQ